MQLNSTNFGNTHLELRIQSKPDRIARSIYRSGLQASLKVIDNTTNQIEKLVNPFCDD